MIIKSALREITRNCKYEHEVELKTRNSKLELELELGN